MTNALYLSATRAVSLANAADNTNNLNSSVVLNNLSSNNANILAIQQSVNSASSRSSYNQALAATLPSAIDDAAPQLSMSFTNQVFDVMENQLSTVNTGGAGGVASGSQPSGLNAWAQALGQHENQDERGGIAGYKANTFGGAVGADTRNLGKDDVIGLSFAYGNTQVDSRSANSTATDIDTYQLSLYGNHAFAQNYFMSGMAAFGWDNNNETRHDVGGVAGLDANGSYDSWQGAGRVEAGRNYRLDQRYTGVILTPVLSADYTHYHANGYTESGAGLNVSALNEDVLNLGIGGRMSWLLHTADGLQITPDIHARYQYDVLNNDQADVTSTFTAGGGTFATNGLNPSNSTFNIGAGIKLNNTANWSLSAIYDVTAKPDYTENTGLLRASFKF